MDDKDIMQNIERLVHEENSLRDADGVTAEEKRRLEAIEVALDQCWDLLRQRRGKRHAGADPESAKVRGPATVERYQQ